MAVERIYVIPLRKDLLKAQRYRRAKKAVRIIREFLSKHMKVEEKDVRLGRFLNELLWSRGIKNPPTKVKVKANKENEIVRVELLDLTAEQKKIIEEDEKSMKELQEKKRTEREKAEEERKKAEEEAKKAAEGMKKKIEEKTKEEKTVEKEKEEIEHKQPADVEVKERAEEKTERKHQHPMRQSLKK